MEYNKVCFMYRHEDYAIDGIRSALGLAVENMYSYGVVMDTDLPAFDEYVRIVLPVLQDCHERVAQSPRSSPDRDALLNKKCTDLIDRRRPP